MPNYFNKDLFVENAYAVSHLLRISTKVSPLNLDAINEMPTSEMERWLEDRYTKGRMGDLTADCLGFPFGYSPPGLLEFPFGANIYPLSLYQISNDGYKQRFRNVLRGKLEEKIEKITRDTTDVQSERFLGHGIYFITELRLNEFSDILLKTLKPFFDFDYNGVDDSKENLYFRAVLGLQVLKAGLSQEFWNRFTEDPRLVNCAVLAKDFTTEQQFERLLRFWDKIPDPRGAAYGIFSDYCEDTNQKPAKGYKLDPIKKQKLQETIRHKAGDKQAVLLEYLELIKDSEF